ADLELVGVSACEVRGAGTDYFYDRQIKCRVTSDNVGIVLFAIIRNDGVFCAFVGNHMSVGNNIAVDRDKESIAAANLTKLRTILAQLRNGESSEEIIPKEISKGTWNSL